MIDTSSARWLVDEINDVLDEVAEDLEDTRGIDRAQYKLDELRNELDSLDEDAEDDVPDLTTYDLSDFKRSVLDAIPINASLKFRLDVEEMLQKFDHVY